MKRALSDCFISALLAASVIVGLVSLCGSAHWAIVGRPASKAFLARLDQSERDAEIAKLVGPTAEIRNRPGAKELLVGMWATPDRVSYPGTDLYCDRPGHYAARRQILELRDQLQGRATDPALLDSANALRLRMDQWTADAKVDVVLWEAAHRCVFSTEAVEVRLAKLCGAVSMSAMVAERDARMKQQVAAIVGDAVKRAAESRP